MKTLNALKVRREFGGILDEICRDGEPVVITRANKPLVVVLPYEEYGKLLEKGEKEKKLRRVFHEIKEWSKRHEEATKELKVVDVIREIRQGE